MAALFHTTSQSPYIDIVIRQKEPVFLLPRWVGDKGKKPRNIQSTNKSPSKKVQEKSKYKKTFFKSVEIFRFGLEWLFGFRRRGGPGCWRWSRSSSQPTTTSGGASPPDPMGEGGGANRVNDTQIKRGRRGSIDAVSSVMPLSFYRWTNPQKIKLQ